MAAKLLHSLADDNPDLQKQIGCMTGIFQLFDRQQVLTARRITQKRLPSGNSHFIGGSLERDSNSIHHGETATDMSLNKGVFEKQRISTESSRASFSSCSSSVSSLDCKAEVEAPFDRIIFPETPSRDTVMNQPTISPHLGRHSLDLRDVVKDSMHRDARGLSVKTTAKEESAFYAMKHRDSPRPLQLSKSVDGSYGVGIDGKQSVPIDLKESIRVLAKLREAPWYYAETRELPRSSNEIKDGHWNSISKDAPWFAYDGRETSRLSFESRDTIKSTPKIKELPRLSLDSKEGSWRSYSSDSKPSHLSRNVYNGTSTSNERFSSLQQSTQSRPPSVVAKLMGLETLPDSSLAGDTQSSSTETYSAQVNDQFPRSSKSGFTRPLRVSNSPKSSLKDPTSPRRKNPDLVMKPISSSRFPIEPAPWKQQDANRSSQKQSSRAIKAPAKTSDSFPSVYSEIEKRLKDLEFKQSGRDLRALKQILEAMQEKGLLESRKEEQGPNVVVSQSDYEPKAANLIPNSRSVRQQNPQGNNFPSSTIKGSDSARTFESPIVIMKPAKLIEKTGISASSVIPIGGISGSHKLQSGGVYVDNKNGTSSTRVVKDQSPKNICRDTSAGSNDKKAISAKTTRSAQSHSRSDLIRSAPPTDSNKPRRQSGKKATESGSPGGKQRPKVPNLQHSDEQLSGISTESKSFSYKGDEISLQSDGTTVNSMMDMEVTSSFQSAEINDNLSPSLKAMKKLVSETLQKNSTQRLDEDEAIAELATDAPEHPSPISVLDGSVYRDDLPSPVKQISEDPKESVIVKGNNGIGAS
ncbi:DUF3741-associated sequence motif [Sesbania bispinosa]|nr:DUF3741-associated sequence motif [Sesbania bispinosa]